MIQTVLPVAVAKTLVFFDLETTSLPSKMQRAHITEMAFVAVDRGHFETQQKPPFRVLNKLALCIRPPALIHPIASQKSGLFLIFCLPLVHKSGPYTLSKSLCLR